MSSSRAEGSQSNPQLNTTSTVLSLEAKQNYISDCKKKNSTFLIFIYSISYLF